jgi:hypothetical protein
VTGLPPGAGQRLQVGRCRSDHNEAPVAEANGAQIAIRQPEINGGPGGKLGLVHSLGVQGGRREIMLRTRTETFIHTGQEDINDIIRDCLADGSIEALVCVRRLYEDMYGGMTYNLMLKSPAAAALVYWGENGLTALVEAATAKRTSKNVSLCLDVLASLAAGEQLPQMHCLPADLEGQIRSKISTLSNIEQISQKMLVRFVLAFEGEDDVASAVGSKLSQLGYKSHGPVRELFAALSARWLAVSTPTLESYEKLLLEQPDNETAFQDFITSHPQILDPMAVQVWPCANIYGSRFPDSWYGALTIRIWPLKLSVQAKSL